MTKAVIAKVTAAAAAKIDKMAVIEFMASSPLTLAGPLPDCLVLRIMLWTQSARQNYALHLANAQEGKDFASHAKRSRKIGRIVELAIES
ncbi:hypothetical protein LG047_00260 [Methylocystis sp. WRRC1]|uniref:hypothetical protein n=1 Tax=Methylocystis sp. WRRC1 TaxID=1732014 RepID=UPI001D137C04|nr:hypothetical protein [Methylocystis sp. WRRC1]MCC3243768.1 hypothetical protein [Methylocystis sp. WRRC1]